AAPETTRGLGGAERARTQAGLDDDDAVGERRDDRVASREVPRLRRRPRRERAEQRTALADAIEHAGVTERVGDVDAGAEDGEGHAPLRQRALVRRAVDAERAAGD